MQWPGPASWPVCLRRCVVRMALPLVRRFRLLVGPSRAPLVESCLLRDLMVVYLMWRRPPLGALGPVPLVWRVALTSLGMLSWLSPAPRVTGLAALWFPECQDLPGPPRGPVPSRVRLCDPSGSRHCLVWTLLPGPVPDLCRCVRPSRRIRPKTRPSSRLSRVPPVSRPVPFYGPVWCMSHGWYLAGDLDGLPLGPVPSLCFPQLLSVSCQVLSGGPIPTHVGDLLGPPCGPVPSHCFPRLAPV